MSGQKLSIQMQFILYFWALLNWDQPASAFITYIQVLAKYIKPDFSP